MKYITSLILTIFLLNLVYAPSAMAQDATGAEISCSASIEEKLGVNLKTFFQKLKQGDLRGAYYMTHATFRSYYLYSEFKEIAAGTALTDNISYKWLDFKIDPITFLLPRTATLTGEFTAPDGNIHTLQFALVKESGIWRIKDILEVPLISYFKKIFPSGAQLKKKIAKE